MKKNSRIKTLLLDKIHYSGIKILKSFSEVDYGWDYSKNTLLSVVHSYDILIVKSNNNISRDVIKSAKKLKIIGRAGSGLDNIDLDAAKKRKIKVITSPAGNAVSVAEYIIGMIITSCHKIFDAHLAARNNDFRRNKWCGRNLADLHVGVLGLGEIGRSVVRKLENLSFKTYGYDYKNRSHGLETVENFKLCNNLESFLKKINVLTINVPLCSSTINLLSDKEFNIMMRGVILINTSRGGIIDENALLRSIKKGFVSYAVLDVLAKEPDFHKVPELNNFSHPFINNNKIFYTPHIAAGTKDALKEVAITLSNKIKKELDYE